MTSLSRTGPARLHNRRDAGSRRFFHSIGKREIGIGSEHRALEIVFQFAGFNGAKLDGVHAAHLAGPHARQDSGPCRKQWRSI